MSQEASTDLSRWSLIRDIDGWATATTRLSQEKLWVLLVFVCL